jgi:hypothetical protein
MGFGKKDLRNKIRTIEDRKYKDVYVKEWDEKFTLQSLTAAQNGKLQRLFLPEPATRGRKQVDKYPYIHATAMVMAVVDPETKEPIFTQEDVYWLKEKNAGALQTIYDAVSDMNNLSEEDQEELKNASEASQKNDFHFD